MSSKLKVEDPPFFLEDSKQMKFWPESGAFAVGDLRLEAKKLKIRMGSCRTCFTLAGPFMRAQTYVKTKRGAGPSCPGRLLKSWVISVRKLRGILV